MIFAGSLTETLTFYSVTETQSASGYKDTSEVLRYTCRAYRTKNKEKYTVDADELFHTNELTFKLRNRKEVEETDVVIYNGERYRITSLNRYPRENDMTLILVRIND